MKVRVGVGHSSVVEGNCVVVRRGGEQPDTVVPQVRCIARQGTEALDHLNWDWVETSVWTERMLAALGNGVKGGKWFSLIDKVYDRHTLEAAWKRVAANRGAAGVDKISIKCFKAGKDRYLYELEKDLRKGLYQPEPVRRVYIPKGEWQTRPLPLFRFPLLNLFFVSLNNVLIL